MANNYMRTEARWNNIKAVMGWDIGDGDSVAFIKLIIGGDNVLRPLYLHKSRDLQVEKSAVAINSSGVITIGEDAAKRQDFAINFKRSPENWDHQYVMGLTYRQHMSNYIRGVSEAILQNSSNRDTLGDIITKDDRGNMHWKKDEVLLAVGCPASAIWKGEKMRRQYEELISEATGISNVIVTEESRAAFFSLFEIEEIRGKINLQAGILVLDFGSSTADATYILPGKRAFNISWELGAAQVENAMLECILQSSKAKKLFENQAKIYGIEKVLVARNDCKHTVFQLRLDKEAYFDGNLGEDAKGKNVFIPIMDEDGNRLFDDYSESAELAIPYRVTDEMMRYALDKYEFDAKKDGVTVNCGTWRENCHQFLNDVKQTLEQEKLSVQAVVVTGGGSQMPFVVELSGGAFPGKVIPSDTPSHSVVKGLVTIAHNEAKALEVYKKALDDIKSDAEADINAMLESIVGNLVGKAYNAAVSALDDYFYFGTDPVERIYMNLKPSNDWVITQVVKNAVSKSLDNNVKREVDYGMKTWMYKDNAAIVRRINEASLQIYADQAMRDMVQISGADVEAISKNISLPNVSMQDVEKDANFIGKIVGYILNEILLAVMSVFATSIPICLIVEEIKRNEYEKTKKIIEPLHQALRETFTKPDAYGKDFEKRYMVLMETAEMAFNRILLRTEDD